MPFTGNYQRPPKKYLKNRHLYSFDKPINLLYSPLRGSRCFGSGPGCICRAKSFQAALVSFLAFESRFMQKCEFGFPSGKQSFCPWLWGCRHGCSDVEAGAGAIPAARQQRPRSAEPSPSIWSRRARHRASSIPARFNRRCVARSLRLSIPIHRPLPQRPQRTPQAITA